MTAVVPKTAGSYWELIDDQHLNSVADIRSPVGTNTAHTRTTNRGRHGAHDREFRREFAINLVVVESIRVCNSSR